MAATVASGPSIRAESILAGDVDRAVRDACLWLPEAEEFVAHGAPNFRVRGKTFATYAVNHHGDGRVALWLNAPPGSQEQHLRAEAAHFFVPAYVGPRGWLGVSLDRGIEWKRVVALVREAYEKVAPGDLQARVGATPALKGPGKALSASQIDPMKSRRGLAVLNCLRKICMRLPESHEERQFGHPVWQAGKKTFALARHDGERITLNFWVGLEQQGLLISDPRFHIPAYMGHNGWIALDVTSHCDRKEVEALIEYSYRHFALKRMLLRLPPRGIT